MSICLAVICHSVLYSRVTLYFDHISVYKYLCYKISTLNILRLKNDFTTFYNVSSQTLDTPPPYTLPSVSMSLSNSRSLQQPVYFCCTVYPTLEKPVYFLCTGWLNWTNFYYTKVSQLETGSQLFTRNDNSHATIQDCYSGGFSQSLFQ